MNSHPCPDDSRGLKRRSAERVASPKNRSRCFAYSAKIFWVEGWSGIRRDLPEFRIANGQQTLGPIDILELEIHCFAEAHTCYHQQLPIDSSVFEAADCKSTIERFLAAVNSRRISSSEYR